RIKLSEKFFLRSSTGSPYLLGFSSSFSFVKVLSLAVQPGCPARNTGYNTLTCHFCLLSLSVSSSLYLFLSLSAFADFFISFLQNHI
ncbi:MAG: hypothetical protein J6H20_09605, partial [Pyramidobacter sp.]|nr:hypothetical protein [Pyramidobacter sp.]